MNGRAQAPARHPAESAREGAKGEAGVLLLRVRASDGRLCSLGTASVPVAISLQHVHQDPHLPSPPAPAFAPAAPSALPLSSPPPAYRVRGAADDGRARRLRQVEKRTVDMLFVRGDGVILVSPPLRTS